MKVELSVAEINILIDSYSHRMVTVKDHLSTCDGATMKDFWERKLETLQSRFDELCALNSEALEAMERKM